MVLASDIFEDVAAAIESWSSAAAEATTVTGKNLQWVEDEAPYRAMLDAFQRANVDTAAVKKVFDECLRGLAVSIFTVMDGGSAAAEKGRVYLVDQNGKRLGEGLHEEFVGYLLDTGRLA